MDALTLAIFALFGVGGAVLWSIFGNSGDGSGDGSDSSDSGSGDGGDGGGGGD